MIYENSDTCITKQKQDKRDQGHTGQVRPGCDIQGRRGDPGRRYRRDRHDLRRELPSQGERHHGHDRG